VRQLTGSNYGSDLQYALLISGDSKILSSIVHILMVFRVFNFGSLMVECHDSDWTNVRSY